MAEENFDAIEAPAASVTIKGRVFAVSPITIGKLPAFSRALRPLLPLLGPLVDIEDDSDPGIVVESLMEILSEHGSRLIDAVTIGVAPTINEVAALRADVEAMDPAEFIACTLTVVRVNADFFARRLLPAVNKAAQEARSLGAGLTPSKP